MRVILAFCIAVGMACGDVVHGATYTKEECVDGMKVAVVMDATSSPQAVHGYQLMSPSGTPLLCGQRLKVLLAIRTIQTKAFSAVMTKQNEQLRQLIK